MALQPAWPAQIVLALFFLSAIPEVSTADVKVVAKPNILLVVADDLGYNDLGYKNRNKTMTPHIDGMVSKGVRLEQYYTFKLCSPTRASIQSGRYPWGVGFYDMDDKRFGDSFHCIHPNTTLLPELLKRQGYATHAIGKWDVGYIKRHCLPTYRGYDTFLGYYTACTSDYWYHGAPGGNLTYSKCGGVDFHDSRGTNIRGATMQGPNSVNDTYDQEVFTSRAVKIIEQHPQDGTPLFIYLAYHNVHDTCQGGGKKRLGLNAPMNTVNQYAQTKLDIWKVQGAMTTELDYGLGNLSVALQNAGMWNNSVLVFVSDNGGPLDHSNNYPLRGGKGSLWEGGVRVEAWVYSPLIPSDRHGTVWPGLAHSSDWYVTLVEGVAGAPAGTTAHTGPRAPDGRNLWPALMGKNLTSPRVEVVHRVLNRFFNTSLGDGAGMAARFREMKIMVGVNCQGDQVWQKWPEPSPAPVPFGLSGGVLEADTDHARVAALSSLQQQQQQQSPVGADPKCKTGLPVDYHGHGTITCCAKECGVCGAKSECQLPVKDGKPCPCASRPGGAAACCVGTIGASGRMCATNDPPCIVSRKHHDNVCLFNLTADPTERVNLAAMPAYAQLIEKLLGRLRRIGSTGPPLRDAFPADIGMQNSTAKRQSCTQTERTGFLGPLD